MERYEWFHSGSHLVGCVASVIGGVVLVVMAGLQGDPWKILSFTIYGLSLIALYGSSAMYHGLPPGARKDFYRHLDHCAIYLLIVGSYTPFTLVAVGGAWGWRMTSIALVLAVAGITYECLAKGRHRYISVIIYLAMGWLIITDMHPMIVAVPRGALVGLIVGGLFYTCGLIFFALTYTVSFAHSIWHVFVLCGSICHYFAVLWYIA